MICPPVVGFSVRNWVRPVSLLQLTPIAFRTVRLTSAILTWRLTWFGVATDSWLTTLPLVSLAIAAARAFAFSARPALEILPFSTSEPSTDSTEMFSPGIR